MALTPRQQITIKNLAVKDIKTPVKIIAYCEMKLKLPVYNPARKHRPIRRHSREYFKQIINFYKING